MTELEADLIIAENDPALAARLGLKLADIRARMMAEADAAKAEAELRERQNEYMKWFHAQMT